SVGVLSAQVEQIKKNGHKSTFDRQFGFLKSKEDRYGNTITFEYDPNGDLSRVTDTVGRHIYFYRAPSSGMDPESGRLTKITDPAGRSVEYEYDSGDEGVVLTKVIYPVTDWHDDTVTPWSENAS